MQESKGYYNHISTMPEPLDSKPIKQIDKDISRTFSGDESFSKEELRRILVAYSVRNPNVGYCQGLNFIVAILLSFEFTEEETFWIYSQIIEKILPIDYYNSMAGVILDQKVFDYLFRAKMPKICKFLEKIGIQSWLFNIQWFIFIYSFTFPKETILFVWDQIFLKGYHMIFPIGLSAIWLLRKKILSQNDFIQTLSLIEQGCFGISDSKMLKKVLNKRVFRISDKVIKKLKFLLEKDVIDEFNQRFSNVISQEQLLNSLNESCIDENECKQKVLKTRNYFTFISSSSTSTH